MHDLTKAKKIIKDTVLISYILELAPGIWVPLDVRGETISGPSHKADARYVVSSNAKTRINL